MYDKILPFRFIDVMSTYVTYTTYNEKESLYIKELCQSNRTYHSVSLLLDYPQKNHQKRMRIIAYEALIIISDTSIPLLCIRFVSRYTVYVFDDIFSFVLTIFRGHRCIPASLHFLCLPFFIFSGESCLEKYRFYGRIFFCAF